MAAPMENKRVELGFVEKTESWRLSSHFFPSKVGGPPAFLSLKPLPSAKDLSCGRCGEPCAFLLQVYSPDNEKPSCFHRTVFVFVCKNPKCCKLNDASNFIILRSQLARDNDFYSREPPPEPEDEEDCETGPRAEDFGGVCTVCGASAPYNCSKCHTAKYCGKTHQTLHWKAGHRKACGQTDSPAISTSFLFPEYELVTETEDLPEESTQAEKTEEEKMAELAKFTEESTNSGDLLKHANMDVKDLESMASGIQDKQFEKFKKRIDLEPEQVLRYNKGGEPLWVSAENIPSDTDIPKCSCGAKRQFEFQILPQLLSHLNVDSLEESIDWGNLAVYTCMESCGDGTDYHREFVWKQDFSHTKS